MKNTIQKIFSRMKTKSPRELLVATGYKLYIDEAVLEAAPRSSGRERVEVFTINKSVTNAELLEEYESRGLAPASLDAILSVEKEYQFIATIWSRNYIRFGRWRAGRFVHVRRYERAWDGLWVFCGVRKQIFKKEMNSYLRLSLKLLALVLAFFSLYHLVMDYRGWVKGSTVGSFSACMAFERDKRGEEYCLDYASDNSHWSPLPFWKSTLFSVVNNLP